MLVTTVLKPKQQKEEEKCGSPFAEDLVCTERDDKMLEHKQKSFEILIYRTNVKDMQIHIEWACQMPHNQDTSMFSLNGHLSFSITI